MLKSKIDLIPHLPGSYQMKNKNGTIIYVGKAKDLRNRVSSYFNNKQTGKTKKMVSEIDDFSYIVTNSELEAFILELNLIKKYDPKYNILLKDDKSYPYIELVKKPYPKLSVVRYLKVKKSKNNLLFGPFQNVYAARRMVKLLNRLYPLKKCSGNPKEVCLYYHIGECLGYCVNQISDKKIEDMIKEITSFLKGNDKLIKDKILERIKFHSNNLNYEVAKELKEELDYMNILLAKQRVEVLSLKEADVINYYFDKGYISIEIFFIRNSKIVGNYSDILPVINDELENIEYLLSLFYQKHEIPKMIIINQKLNSLLLKEILNAKIIKPLKGDKKKLLDMAYKNAKINLINKFEIIKKDENKTEKANQELKEVLKLTSLDRIDIFDNSNLFGNYSVSAMVVYKNGLPSKKDYRKYKICLEKPDDYNIMKEVIYRRYYKALLEKLELPDLILVDGGINQINACKEVLDSLHLDIKVCGLKKNDKHKTSELIDGDTLESIALLTDSNLFYYLTNIQDEVHRFTISYHRQIRSKGSISSILDNIPNIGPERKKALLKKYGSLAKIKEASIEDLVKIIPLKVAENLKEYLENY
ncbi:MAG TPA: excinuclease ABC subunit UvrC [Bacilli bacterium]|nr:excinuclease ABC subunit UvrC [Bacilli bacterium]